MTNLSRFLGSQAEDDCQLLEVSLNLRGEAALAPNNLLSVNPAKCMVAIEGLGLPTRCLGFEKRL